MTSANLHQPDYSTHYTE